LLDDDPEHAVQAEPFHEYVPDDAE